MSFFDEDEEPTRTTSRSRPRPRPRRGSPAGVAPGSAQTVMVRRLVLGVIVVLFVLVAGLLIKGCSTSRHKNALRDYNRQVSGIATESRQTGAQFFDQLGQGDNQSPTDLQSAVSSFKAQAETALKQAQAISTPGEMTQAQQSLLIALELRRDGLEAIAGDIRTALGDSGDAADKAIGAMAGQMRAFDASDVLYSSRVIPFIQRALNDADVGGQQIAQSRFLNEIDWISPAFVASKLGQQLSTSGTSGSSTGRNQPTGPGLHGTGLNSTTYGDATLSPTAANRLTYVAGQPFTVTFTNQGDNDEFNVKVTVKIATSDGKTVATLNKTVAKIAKGEKAPVELPLSRTPPTGAAVNITVTVASVPGETKKDNNTSQYSTLFVAG